MIESINQPWAWYVGGPMIALVMFLLLYSGKEFGVSSNLRTLCTIGGGDAISDFFKLDWKRQQWNLMFVLGSVIGGFLAMTYLGGQGPVKLHPSTIHELNKIGFTNSTEYLPAELFDLHQGFSLKTIAILWIGGMLVGFGARYAGGCTSGHAISGLSNLQLPSLIAVIGFFIGGLTMVYVLMPIIFS